MTRNAASTIEDLEFLDEAGTSAIEAASRLGFASSEALNVWLQRNDAADLWASMHARDPKGTGPIRALPPRPQERPVSDPIIALLDEADASDRAPHRNKAAKIRALLKDLRAEMDGDRERRESEREAREAIERLEAELAEAKARLRGPRPVSKPTRNITRGEFPCADCGRIFDTNQGRALHARRTHVVSAA